jgi:2-succinyl-5-enolpyruvyl-6-hydroxy-3-cyclohexene-1-carboxylate synthase
LHHDTFINNIDTIITPFTNEDFENFCPEILVTLAEWSFRNESKLFLRKYKPKHHWHIDSWRGMIRLAL